MHGTGVHLTLLMIVRIKWTSVPCNNLHSIVKQASSMDIMLHDIYLPYQFSHIACENANIIFLWVICSRAIAICFGVSSANPCNIIHMIKKYRSSSMIISNAMIHGMLNKSDDHQLNLNGTIKSCKKINLQGRIKSIFQSMGPIKFSEGPKPSDVKFLWA